MTSVALCGRGRRAPGAREPVGDGNDSETQDTGLATPLSSDGEGTVRMAFVGPALDPLDQRCLERVMGRPATRPGAALPRQCVARAPYLHQNLVRHRRRREILIESIINGFPGPLPCWQDPVFEPLHDERGFAQLPRDGLVPAVAGERWRAVEAAGGTGTRPWRRAPIAPHGLVLHSLVPDLLLSAFDDTAAASLRVWIYRCPEGVRPSA